MSTILLIEDDPFLIDIYSLKLKSKGFKVQSAASGKHALAFLKDKKPDLVILDIVLPGALGWQVLEKIKSTPNLADLKVIILSNLGQQEEVDKGLRLGAVKYLIKAQFTPGEVVAEIEKILK